MTDGNSPAVAQHGSGSQIPASPRLHSPTNHIHAPGAPTQDPNLLLRPATRIQAHAALRPGPSPATTFPGSFQQGEETGVGREEPGELGISPRGGRGGARLKVPRSLAPCPDIYPHV